MSISFTATFNRRSPSTIQLRDPNSMRDGLGRYRPDRDGNSCCCWVDCSNFAVVGSSSGLELVPRSGSDSKAAEFGALRSTLALAAEVLCKLAELLCKLAAGCRLDVALEMH